nr:MAG TPA: hypothetical protein [Caudoviricetes sp.]
MLSCHQRGTQEGRANQKLIKKSFSQVTGSDAESLAFSVSKCPYNYIIYNPLLINSIQYRIIILLSPS